MTHTQSWQNQTKIPVASTVGDFVHKFHSWLCLPTRRPILHVGGGPLLFLWDISKCPEGCVSLSVCPHKGKELLSAAAHNTADPCSIRDGLSGMYRLPASYRDLVDFHGQSAERWRLPCIGKLVLEAEEAIPSRRGIIDMHSRVKRHRGPWVQQAEPRSPRVLSSDILYQPKQVYEGCSK